MYSRLEDRERTMSKGQNKYRAERMEKQAESGFRKGKNQDKGSRRRDGYKKKSVGVTRDMKERQAGKYGRSRDGRPAGYGSGYGYREEDLRRDQEAVFDDGAEKIFGRNPVIAALRGSREVEHIYIARGSEGSAKQIAGMAKDSGVPLDFVDREVINAMARGERHQGVAARVSEYSYSTIQDVFKRAEESGEDPFVIVLDEISDPHNLGAVIRTAECAGAHGVIIPKRRACGLTGVAAKASAGAIESVPVVRVTNISRTLDELKELGLWIAACDMGGQLYYKADLSGPLAVVIGSEGSGISKLVKDKCDFTVSMPLKGKVNSLNASNAAAVIMYEVRRRRDMLDE